MRTQRTWLLAIVVLVLLAVRPGIAAAEVRVKALKVTAAPGGPAVTRFQPGTKTVYATFDYEGAVNHKVGVMVTARGGLSVFESARRYTGGGSDTVPIDGTTVTHALATGIAEAARAAQADAERAATQPFGVQEYLQAVEQDLMLADAAVVLLSAAPIGDVNVGRLDSVRLAANDVTLLVNAALGLPPSDVARKRELATQMAPHAAEMAANADQLDRSVQRLTDLPIPETGNAPHATYTVQVRVTDLDYPADSAEFSVARDLSVVLPWLGRAASLRR
jgi:hypothetical protein